jgi:glycosyltransferase involved in cell wall biosynthesis
VKVLIVAPVPPPYGGMALQAQQLEALLKRDGVDVETFATNFPLPTLVRGLERVPLVRTLTRALLIWFRLRRSMRAATVVHVLAASWVYFFLAVYPAVLIARASGKRIVVNYRGGEAREFFARCGWLCRPVFRLADAVTAPSEFLAGVIRARFGVSVSIVPNILDSSLFTYRARPRLEPRLLVTRHLEPMYDVESVLRAFRVIQEHHPEASLSIAGGGSQRAHLERLVGKWRLNHVRFLGEIAHRELPALYDQCDIYVNASLVDNFPGALVEASAAGLVVVTTGAGGIPYIYEHGRTAFLVKPGDWQALAGAVEHVLAHPDAGLAATRLGVEVARACDWCEVRKRLFESYGVRGEPGSTASLNGARCAAG